ncbi:MAG: helix-turn-helix domain-containing protein [Holophagales bacterium]|jgi:DNA-binding XRE family transcriptional regulator|nr:helix-turn-helix domain-containing protein [Holophagales bacterium]
MIPTDDGATESKPDALSTLGERIKAVRVAWDWPQEEMAEILRVDQASISFWERDKIKPSGSAIVTLAALFRTTIEALEKGENFVMPTAPGRGEGIRRSRALPRGVCLPVADPDKVTIVDFRDGGITAPQLSEAMISLGQYAKESRKVWIVVE